jgi:glycosyltransferase involved in cell wall biosynthesis
LRVLILTDGAGWIVDRITDVMIEKMPFDFTKEYYTRITPEQFVDMANKHDLVHYQNWDLRGHLHVLEHIKKPILLSIRSFRYPDYVYRAVPMVTKIHVVNHDLLEFFPSAYYIPDGIFDQFFQKKDFIVGFAGKKDDYKGFPLIQQACAELGATFMPASGDIPPDMMVDYYNQVDLVVCASLMEGFNSVAMECLAMNKPMVTTDVGEPKNFKLHKISRTVGSIKEEIMKHWTYPLVKDYTWDNICGQFTGLYNQLGNL